ncbi:MAG: glycerophosphodiester phosphodiesterase family protein [Gammaproteobacteria bacterium]|jgi:glycerophosphoryl diester phosphodiesterase
MTPVLVAHRGYMEKYPENSLSAIRAALDAGACMVEFDVQMDALAQLVLLHDDNLKRTAGLSASVFKQADYGGVSVHEPKRLGNVFDPEPVPTLLQALELIQRYPAATAFVEIKDESIQYWGLEKVVDEVLSCVGYVQQQCVIISDNLDALRYIKNQSGIRLGWVIHRYDDNHHELAARLGPDYMICNYRRINKDLWQGSWQWMLYDITDPELALQWAEKGAGLVETGDIGVMLQHPVLKQRACHHL